MPSPISSRTPVVKAPGPVSPTPSPVAPAAPAERTALQRHVDYFDRNGDHLITTAETRYGLKRLGLGPIARVFLALGINLGLGKKTSGKLTVIDANQIHKGKHAGDTGTVDTRGGIVPEKFEDMFVRFDTNKSNTLDKAEIAAMLVANKAGLPSKAEFGLLLKVAADGKEVVDGKTVPSISRARLAKLYDGTLFEELARVREAASKH